MRRWSAIGLVLLATTACTNAASPAVRYGGLAQPSGSKIVYADVRRHWMEQTVVDGLQERDTHLGVLAIDPEAGTARYEQGRVFCGLRCSDVLGREFYSEHVEGGDDKPYETALLMREPSGRKHVLRTEIGEITNLAVANQDGTAWVFYLRNPVFLPEAPTDTGMRELADVAIGIYDGTVSASDLPESTGCRVGKRWGTYAVARVNADTREAAYLPFPTCGPMGTWDWLVAQNRDVVFLTGGQRGGQARTWRGDFSTGQWAKPIEGDFVVMDAQGTLIERRDGTWSRKAGLGPTQAEIITSGRRATIDLGLPGRVQPLFGSGRVVLFDPASKRWVLRSVAGAPDLWLPGIPPTRGRVRLDTK